MLKCKECGENLSKENYVWKYACRNPNCKLLGIYIYTRKEKINVINFYREDGRVVGIYDVCDWWYSNFPPEKPRFDEQGKIVNRIRLEMRKLDNYRVRVMPSLNIKSKGVR